jgi:hypothetical protein
MAGETPELRALKRLILTVVGAFIGSFIAFFAGGTYLRFHYLNYPRRWWSIAWDCAMMVVYATLGAVIVTFGALYLLDRWNYWRGVYRCNFCGGPLPRKGWCSCQAEEYAEFLLRYPPRPPRRPWRHYRRRLVPALGAHLILIPVAGAIVRSIPLHPSNQFSTAVLLFHAFLCYCIWLFGELQTDLLKSWGIARRYRLRAIIFTRLFFLWGGLGLLSILFFLIR